MYGLVNAAFRELMITRHGPEKWQEIRRVAGVAEDTFPIMNAYPDAITDRMIAAASEVLRVPSVELLILFGEFWVSYTEQEGHGALFDIAGTDVRDFLLHLDELHARVGKSFPKLRPPSFRFDILNRDKMRMHYVTEREGLCYFVVGLLQGLSTRFRTSIQIDDHVCRMDGAPHCEFLIRIGEKRNS